MYGDLMHFNAILEYYLHEIVRLNRNTVYFIRIKNHTLMFGREGISHVTKISCSIARQ